MPRAFLFVPGILQRPAGHNDWSDYAVDWVEANTPHAAQEYEYKSPALTRFIGQERRIKAVAHIIRTNPGFAWSGVGHSNGCAVLLGMLDQCPDIKFDALNLIAAAAPAHCGTNGLNGIAARGQVGAVHLFGSHNDEALWWGGLSRKLFGWCGLGYGDLGRAGPCNATPELAAIMDQTWRDDLGHCDWFRADEFERTMRNVTR